MVLRKTDYTVLRTGCHRRETRRSLHMPLTQTVPCQQTRLLADATPLKTVICFPDRSGIMRNTPFSH